MALTVQLSTNSPSVGSTISVISATDSDPDGAETVSLLSVNFLWEISSNGVNGWTPAPGGTNSASYNVTAAVAGDFLRATVTWPGDPGDANDSGSSPATSQVPPPVFPDLAVSSISAPASVSQGSTLSVSYAVSDIGAGPVQATSQAGIFLDGQAVPVGQDLINPMAAGGLQTVNHSISTIGLSVGQHTLIVTADYGNAIVESNEGNNTRSVTFNVTAPSGSAVAKLDFNHDGSSDVVWRNANGALALWEVNGGAVSGSAFTSNGALVAPDSSWSVAGISDFNGDGKADVLWRNTAGQLADWTMSGSAIASSGFVNVNGTIAAPDPSWNVVAVGDLNGDSKSDIVWRSATGALAGWLMNGPTITSSGFLNANGALAAPGSSWNVVGSGDFDGNQRIDLLWRDNASGELALWSMNGTQIAGSGDVMAGGVAARPDSSWSVAGVGDFNGDGHADLLWRNTDGTLAEWLMSGSAIIGSNFITAARPDTSWKIVEIGDFNHHGITDVLWRNDSGALAEWEMNGTAVAASFVPAAGGNAVSPDATWSVLSKPTVYG
jgi:CARDB/FG-GAP-like repeat